MAAKKDDGRRVVAENRKARFEYMIGETYEAGIQLAGTEVKSLRQGQANIAESYASAEGDGLFLINAYIPEYQAGGRVLSARAAAPPAAAAQEARNPQAARSLSSARA